MAIVSDNKMADEIIYFGIFYVNLAKYEELAI